MKYNARIGFIYFTTVFMSDRNDHRGTSSANEVFNVRQDRRRRTSRRRASRRRGDRYRAGVFFDADELDMEAALVMPARSSNERCKALVPAV
jgi:hypothetical protein